MADEIISESSELKTITYESIKDFFQEYIKTYLPYSGGKIYDSLIDNLTDYYYNYAYNNIPADFKDIFETSDISKNEVYNKFLVAIGVPDKLIQSLTYSDKVIFLKSLCDFEKYKATLSFIEKVGESYQYTNKVNIYELYVDYDSTLASPWVLKPNNVYKHDDVDLNLESIDYLTVYNQVPTLLVSTDQLDTLRVDEEIILPLKTNLLFLDYDLSRESSILNDLIVTIFLKEYKNNSIKLYFSDYSHSTLLKNIYFTWYYLLTRYYDLPHDVLANSFVLKFIYNDDFIPFPYNITDIDSLLAEYEAIETITQRDSFYKTRLADVFATWTSTPTPIDHTQMLTMLTLNDPDLATYLDNRLTIIEDADKQKDEVKLILTEIYSSLTLYNSNCGINNFSKYFEYLTNYLPQIIINPKNSITYSIIYNLKPYHVELYTKYQEDIICQNKFNTVWVEDFNFASQRIPAASVITLSSIDHLLIQYISSDDDNIINITDEFIMCSFITYILENELFNESSDPYSFLELFSIISVVVLSSINYSLDEFFSLGNDNISVVDDYSVTKVL